MAKLTRKEWVLREVLGLNPRERGSLSVAEVLKGTIPAAVRQGMSANQRALELWRMANGDVERTHTTGVYLRRSSREGLSPVLVVYVDSHARLSDFSANKEIYLIRLAGVGLEISGIEFRLSRWPAPQRRGGLRKGGSQDSSPALPPLSAVEERRVRDACIGLPDGLRQQVERAMALSLRREHNGGLHVDDAKANGGTA